MRRSHRDRPRSDIEARKTIAAALVGLSRAGHRIKKTDQLNLDDFVLHALAQSCGNGRFRGFDGLMSTRSGSRDSVAKPITHLRGLFRATGVEQSFHRALLGGGEISYLDFAVTTDMRFDSTEASQSSDSFHMEFCHIADLRLYSPTAVQALSTAVFTALSPGNKVPANLRVRFANVPIFRLGLGAKPVKA